MQLLDPLGKVGNRGASCDRFDPSHARSNRALTEKLKDANLTVFDAGYLKGLESYA